jgi:YggT family protein
MDYPVRALVETIVSLSLWVIITNAVLSWLVAFDVINLRNKFVATIYDLCERLTEPLLAPIRRVVPNLGGVDLSPVVLILGLQLLQNAVVSRIPF